jgi:hypothetical protein
MSTDFLPKRFKEYATKPLHVEVMALETELQSMLDNPDPSVRDKELINYVFKRCDKLWKKISAKR